MLKLRLKWHGRDKVPKARTVSAAPQREEGGQLSRKPEAGRPKDLSPLASQGPT